MVNAKLAIMELFSKYLLYMDERKFDISSFAEIFTYNAEARCNILGYYNSFNVDNNNIVAAGFATFSAVNTAEGWRIQKIRRIMGTIYSLNINTKTQEILIE